jgi:hypothetical protein
MYPRRLASRIAAVSRGQKATIFYKKYWDFDAFALG